MGFEKVCACILVVGWALNGVVITEEEPITVTELNFLVALVSFSFL